MNLEDYKSLNASFKKRMVFHLGLEAGFYSEFNNMILSMAYCLRNNIRFELYSKDANFKIRNGWTDYFHPFCYETKIFFHSLLNRRRNYFISSKSKLIHLIFNASVGLFKFVFNIDYLTQDIFELARDRNAEDEIFTIDKLNFKGGLNEMCHAIIDMIWKFNDNSALEIESLINSITMPTEYISMHIRGGDKFIEAPLLEINAYINKAIVSTSIRNAFILTDDYRLFQKLKESYPDWNFYTLTFPQETGYYHQVFIKLNTMERSKYIYKLFASIEIMSKSKLFFGTFSSNIGMFLGMRMRLTQFVGIDRPKWQIW